jgi:hypothetical protein
MDFYCKESDEFKSEYRKFLIILGGLSRLFSDSESPYLYYRAHENLFCKVFDALNLSRGDISFDATKGNIGIGLKTFLQNNGVTFQKVAEFNADSNLLRNAKNDIELVKLVAELRNARLTFALNSTGCESMLYHIVTRENAKMNITEHPMDFVDVQTITLQDGKKNTIRFSDNKHEYTFSKSKSTLLQRFNTKSPIETLDVPIYEDPFSLLEQIKFESGEKIKHALKVDEIFDYIILPLYSTRDGQVQQKSGLNQWNADGRKRDADEVYIPIPSFIHKDYAGFFDYDNATSDKSAKDSPSFTVVLPNKTTIKCKVAQQGGKALMSDPNKDLGKWILRDVLKLQEGTLLTRDMLDRIGVESVRLTKLNSKTYSLDFSGIGSFEEFINHEDTEIRDE